MKDIEIPDDMMDKHFYSQSDTIDDDVAPGPAVEDAEPELDVEDNLPEEDPYEDVELDTEESEAGDVEPVEDELDEETDLEDEEVGEDLEDLEDEPEDTLEDASPEEEESFLPDFDRKKIEEDPELNAAYKHMRAKWTQAQQDLRTSQREFESRKAEFDAFAAQLQSEEGAEEFLVAVALNRPEVFDKAYQRSLELSNDDSERRTWEREQTVKRRERDLERREMADKQAALQAQVQEIQNKTHDIAQRAGLRSPAEVVQAEEAVANVIRAKRARDPNAEITDSDIESAVSRVAEAVEAIKARTRKQLEREYAEKQRKAVKKKAKAAKRPAPPKSSSSPGLKSRKPSSPPKGVDPLDHWVDERLGLGD